jgi:2-oxoglutarate ferredoxin oxidoreductase subunit gamma
MREDVLMVGLGGQGVLLSGEILARAAMLTGLEVSWFPAYSPEVRGGEATCTVVLADGPVGSPIVGSPHNLVLMDAGAVERHLPRAAGGGVAIVNSSLATNVPPCEGTKVVLIPANDIAVGLGNERAVNMVMLGGLIAVKPVITLEQCEAAIADAFGARKPQLVAINVEAVRVGYAAALAGK